MCKDATKHACGGRALRCLTDASAQIRAKGCRDEIFYFEKMEVCWPGQLRHLRTHWLWASKGPSHAAAEHSLSVSCRVMCERHHALQVFDYRNDVILAETCREDVNKFCKKVKKGSSPHHACLSREARLSAEQ